MYSRGQKYQNYFELQVFLLFHRCLGVCNQLPSIARLCREWILLLMKSWRHLVQSPPQGSRVFSAPTLGFCSAHHRLVKEHFPDHRALPLLGSYTLHYPLISIYIQSNFKFLQLSKILETFSAQPFLALFFKFTLLLLSLHKLVIFFFLLQFLLFLNFC